MTDYVINLKQDTTFRRPNVQNLKGDMSWLPFHKSLKECKCMWHRQSQTVQNHHHLKPRRSVSSLELKLGGIFGMFDYLEMTKKNTHAHITISLPLK